MKLKLCPLCLRMVSVTKTGKFYRHGHKRSQKKSWFGAVFPEFFETKEPCSMSGKQHQDFMPLPKEDIQ